MSISREALLGATEVPTEVVSIPELKGTVTVRGMSLRERTLWEKKFISEKGGRQKRNYDAFREQIIVFCCVEPKLTEADVDALAKTRADVVSRIADCAMRLSGISEKDAEELGQPSPQTAATSSVSTASPTS